MNFKAHSTVSYHVKKLLNLGAIECINPTEKVKFYRSVLGVKVCPVVRSKELHINSTYSGRVPDNGPRTKEEKIRYRDYKTGRFVKSRRKKVKNIRNYGTIAHVDGQRLKLCRVHSTSFIAPVTGGPIDKVKWDNISSPNNRFTQHDIKWPVPNIGQTSFRWIKSKNKSDLVIFLPEQYSLPYEIKAENKIIEDKAWQAATWFSKNAHRLKKDEKAKRCRIGLGTLKPYRKTWYGFEATSKQKEYYYKHGPITIDTPTGGKASIDGSKKPDYIEQEYTEINEAKIIADDLSLPGHIANLKRDTKDLKEWILAFQDKFSKFLERDEKKWGLQEKRWEKQDRRWDEQMRFNTRFIEMLQCRDEVTTKSFINSKPTGKSDCIDYMYG